MKTHIVRAVILSVVIVFAMIMAFMQGIRVSSPNTIQLKDIETTEHSQIENGSLGETACFMGSFLNKEKVDATEYAALQFAAKQIADTGPRPQAPAPKPTAKPGSSPAAVAGGGLKTKTCWPFCGEQIAMK